MGLTVEFGPSLGSQRPTSNGIQSSFWCCVKCMQTIGPLILINLSKPWSWEQVCSTGSLRRIKAQTPMHKGSCRQNIWLLHDFIASDRQLERIIKDWWSGSEIACVKNDYTTRNSKFQIQRAERGQVHAHVEWKNLPVRELTVSWSSPKLLPV